MSSPQARKSSPKKAARGSVLVSSPTMRKSITKVETKLSQINIVREINQEDNIAQEKDIEIERLRTTCAQLAS